MTDYRRAFKIACELLNGTILCGVDADKIFEVMMAKDGMVTNTSYEEYILNHLQELDHGLYKESKSDSEEIIEVEPTMVYPIKENHVYASCKCCLPTSYRLDLGEKQPGKHKYRFKCTFCGYSGFVFT